MIYLASPFSHDNKDVVASRVDAACRMTARLIKAGWKVYSPIAYTYSLCAFDVLPESADWWRPLNDHVQRLCDELWVLKLDGWDTSKGIAHEIRLALDAGQPIVTITENHGLVGYETQTEN